MKHCVNCKDLQTVKGKDYMGFCTRYGKVIKDTLCGCKTKSETAKTCESCEYSCFPPTGMKPMYGLGGMMLVCNRPNARKKKGTINMVAPLNKCHQWKAKEPNPMKEDYSGTCNGDDDDPANPCPKCKWGVFPIGCMLHEKEEDDNG